MTLDRRTALSRIEQRPALTPERDRSRSRDEPSGRMSMIDLRHPGERETTGPSPAASG